MKTSTHPTAASRREFLNASATRTAPSRRDRTQNQILISWIGAWAFLALTVQAQQPRLCERWRQAYAGEDATGKNVIGLWIFADTKELLGKGLDAKLQGAVICPDGKFGPWLESFCGYPVEDKRHAAVVASAPSLTPEGAFTLEMWIKPKKELADYSEAFLVDNKYVAHTDYQFTLGAADKGGQRRLNMRLGFGEDSESYASEPAVYATNVWHHVAVGRHRPRRGVPHDRADAPARGVLDEDRAAGAGHHVSRLGVPGTAEWERLLPLHASADPARTASASERGGRTARPGAHAGSRSAERCGFLGELRLADVRAARYVRVGKCMGGRRVSDADVGASPTGNRL